MFNIHTFSHSSILFVILLMVSGCFEMEQVIKLDDDGGMTFSLDYAIPEDKIGAFAQFHQTISHWQGERPGQTWLLNKKAVQQQFSKDIYELTAYTNYEKDGKRHIHIAGNATSAVLGLGNGAVGSFKLETLANGEQRLSLPLPRPSRLASLSAEERQSLLKAAAGLSVSLTIQVPGTIKTTNGIKSQKNRVTWTFGPEDLADPSRIAATLFVTY